jgi:hypothetical protein
MTIRVRKPGQPEAQARSFESPEALLAALAAAEVAGSDEYWAPKEAGWFELDSHPRFSTTDARGIYPAILHLVVFLKIFVFIAFLSLLDGHPEALLHPGAWYVYAVLIGDALAIGLAYANRNRLSALLLWIIGLGSMPLGLFLIVAAGMTRSYRFRPAD